MIIPPLCDHSGITVCMPSIPTRWGQRSTLAHAAIQSVYMQTMTPAAVNVLVDVDHEGAWMMRAKLLETVFTPWLATFDDDDVMGENHLEHLYACALDTDADYVFSYFHTNMADPLNTFGKPFDPNEPHHTTGIILVRTDLAREVGYSPPDPGDIVAGEDWRFTLGCVKAGAKIVHLPERTWFWRWHGPVGAVADPNTSGRPDNWS